MILVWISSNIAFKQTKTIFINLVLSIYQIYQILIQNYQQPNSSLKNKEIYIFTLGTSLSDLYIFIYLCTCACALLWVSEMMSRGLMQVRKKESWKNKLHFLNIKVTTKLLHN